jgi:hypothetical protein
MLKKLLVPCFIFAASVAIGCSSSTPSTTGTAGKGGTAGAGGGTAGAGTAGAGGGTAGAAGSTTDGSTDSTGAGGMSIDASGDAMESTDVATTNGVIVKGLADIWLAGEPNGTILSAGWPSNDVAPANSPVSVSVMAGSTLSVSATGGTSNVASACSGASPDGCGIPDLSGYVHGPANGLSSLVVPCNALVGVFVGAGVPSGTAPVGLVMLAPNSFATLSPLLQQPFFIGDGLIGTGSGAVQQFVVPTGATRLFLGSSDAEGANYDNVGQFMVMVSTLP